MMKLGRNEPCHCGSGKKYKKCHLDSDQRGLTGTREPQVSADVEPQVSADVRSVDIKRLPQLLRQLSEKGSAKDRKQFAELMAETGPLLEYLEHQGKIEAATAELEKHRAEFEEFAADGDRFAAFAQAVFAEECFAPLRFTASDVQRAFDHVGHPGTLAPDEQTARTLRAAILHIADKERRSKLSMRLLLRLAEFVATGRYLEAWMLQCAALETAEDQHESNPFLFHMFSYGYDALAAEKRARDESFLRQLGFDVEHLRGMNLDELDAWVQSHASDPAKATALEAFFHENPDLRAESVANLEAVARNSAKLLEREDSRFLLVLFEEVQPWLTLFNERFSQSGCVSETPDAAPSEERARRMFEEVALPLMREMAEAIFTRDRILRLVADLKKYRSERFAAGDKATPALAMGAITYLEREDSPGENSFLLTLCWRSLDSAIKAMTAEIGCATG